MTISGKHEGIACSKCHQGKPDPDRPSLRYGENSYFLCKECHQYSNERDHHPSSTKAGPFGKTAIVSNDFQLSNKKMSCLTCHHMHNEEDYTKGSDKFLVGGPYKEKRGVCVKCHDKEAYLHLNPHVALSDAGGSSQQIVCLSCHDMSIIESSEMPDRDNLRASDAFLCWRCHPAMENDFLERHYLMEISEGEIFFNSPGGIEEIKGVPDEALHLDMLNRITCSTCHDPHQPFDKSVEKNKPGRIPLRSEKICMNCHAR